MIIKELRDEDFVNYRKPSMFIGFPSCTFKCEKECGERCCQNSALAQAPIMDVNTYDIVNRYIKNPITKAIVIGGLEPFDSWGDLKLLIHRFREKTKDDIVIYTGYTYDELNYSEPHDFIESKIQWLWQFPNIIIKFGRFIPNQQSHYDEVLGIKLASPNQYAERVTYEQI
jgi:organic radical activating enzyme